MFENKTIWITGASSGIGEALAVKFFERGGNLILSARRKTELERVRDRLVEVTGGDGENIYILPFDITDEAGMPDIVQAACGFKGRIDWLVNNAGISQRSLCVDTDMATYRRLFEVDVFGQIALTKQLLPIMLEQGDGHIVITSSVAGKVGVAYRTGYCAAKHAVMGFYDALRAELDQNGIKVTTVTPGFIHTNIAQNALTGSGEKFGQTDKSIAGGMDVDACAEVIVRGFLKNRHEIAVGNGREMHALWLKRLLPNVMFKVAARMHSPD